MMGHLVVLPVVLPLAAAILLVFLRRRPEICRGVSVGAHALHFLAAAWLLRETAGGEILVARIGDWLPPFGIVLVADRLGAVLAAVAALLGLCTGITAVATLDGRRETYGFHPLVHILLMGVCGAFLTGDLFNLYVWFEVMLIASFVLLAQGGERPEIEGAVKYVTLNLLSSAFFLVAIGLLYGLAGTVNLADLARKLPEVSGGAPATVVAMLFLAAFGIKAALFPLFFWLPASYHTPHPVVSALLAGLLTKVGVYSLVRVFTLLFVHDPEFVDPLLMGIAVCTMVSGVLGAMVQTEIRRILSFHIVSQIGYMIFGLALRTEAGLAGAVFYIVHHIVVKTALFLVGGIVERRCGTGRLAELGGLYGSAPGLALLFFVPACALAGVPPFSGFFAKLALVQAGFGAQAYRATAVALGVSLLTLYSMIKIWNEAFWKTAPTPAAPGRPVVPAVAAAAILVLVSVGMGAGAETVFAFARAAAAQMFDSQAYLDAVLGGPR